MVDMHECFTGNYGSSFYLFFLHVYTRVHERIAYHHVCLVSTIFRDLVIKGKCSLNIVSLFCFRVRKKRLQTLQKKKIKGTKGWYQF